LGQPKRHELAGWGSRDKEGTRDEIERGSQQSTETGRSAIKKEGREIQDSHQGNGKSEDPPKGSEGYLPGKERSKERELASSSVQNRKRTKEKIIKDRRVGKEGR